MSVKLYEPISIILVCVVGAAVLVGLISACVGPADNPVEELCEEVIKVETGQSIDFTPHSVKEADAK